MDGDGDLDVISAGLVTSELSIGINSGSAGIVPGPERLLDSGALDLAVCQSDGDSAPALLTALRDANRLEIWRYQDIATPQLVGAAVQRGAGPLAIEPTADGCRIALGRPDAGSIDLFSFTSAGLRHLGTQQTRRPQALTWWSPESSTTDPAPQRLLSVTGTASTLTVFEVTPSAVAPLRELSTYPVPAWPTSIHPTPWSDVFAGAASQANAIFFTAPLSGETRSFDVGAGAFDIAIGDINGDGVHDFAVTEKFDDTIGFYRGVPTEAGALGIPDFVRAATLPTGRGPSAVRLADINGDAILDLVVVEAFDDTIAIAYGLPWSTADRNAATRR